MHQHNYTINFAFTCAKLCSYKAILNLCLKISVENTITDFYIDTINFLQSLFTKLVYHQVSILQ